MVRLSCLNPVCCCTPHYTHTTHTLHYTTLHYTTPHTILIVFLSLLSGSGRPTRQPGISLLLLLLVTTANCQLPTTNCQLPAARCPLPVAPPSPSYPSHLLTPLPLCDSFRPHTSRCARAHACLLPFFFFTDFICFCAWRLALFALEPLLTWSRPWPLSWLSLSLSHNLVVALVLITNARTPSESNTSAPLPYNIDPGRPSVREPVSNTTLNNNTRPTPTISGFICARPLAPLWSSSRATSAEQQAPLRPTPSICEARRPKPRQGSVRSPFHFPSASVLSRPVPPSQNHRPPPSSSKLSTSTDLLLLPRLLCRYLCRPERPSLSATGEPFSRL